MEICTNLWLSLVQVLHVVQILRVHVPPETDPSLPRHFLLHLEMKIHSSPG